MVFIHQEVGQAEEATQAGQADAEALVGHVEVEDDELVRPAYVLFDDEAVLEEVVEDEHEIVREHEQNGEMDEPSKVDVGVFRAEEGISRSARRVKDEG